MTARGLSPASRAVATAPAMLAMSMLQLSASTSQKTGVAPTSSTASTEAEKLKAGTITASPAPIPSARMARFSASVPLAQAITWGAPQNSESAFSSWPTSGPMTNWPWAKTRRIPSSTESPSRRRCACKSTKGIGILTATGFDMSFITPVPGDVSD